MDVNTAIAFGIGILWIFVHIAFYMGVYQDAQQRQTMFVGPGMWAFATLLGGIITVVAYWVIHHSSLRMPGREEDPNNYV